MATGRHHFMGPYNRFNGLNMQNAHLAIPCLNSREKEILQWIAEGKSNGDISVILKISERTVRFHVNKAMMKLDAVNRTQAVAIAIRDELIDIQ